MSPAQPVVDRVAALGGGLIGRSWTALFLAAGEVRRPVRPGSQLPRPGSGRRSHAWPALLGLGLATAAGPGRLVAHDARGRGRGRAGRPGERPRTSRPQAPVVRRDRAAAGGRRHRCVLGVRPDPHRASGRWRDPTRTRAGPPVQPPAPHPPGRGDGQHTGRARRRGPARGFYEAIGKVTIEVKREVPGHAANRLQAALWREAIHLVNEGVATVEDIDTAVSSARGSGGRRWARPRSSTSVGTRVDLPPSASGTPTASTAGGTTWAGRTSTGPPRSDWRGVSHPCPARATSRS